MMRQTVALQESVYRHELIRILSLKPLLEASEFSAALEF